MCDNPTSVELHGFSGASMDAYSAVVYVRTTDCSGNVCVRLLCSKTKVAPVKVLTVPRLELCGALALACLMKQVYQILLLVNFNYFSGVIRRLFYAGYAQKLIDSKFL